MIEYESQSYNEFAMEAALSEYANSGGKPAIIFAEKHGVPVMELYKEFARSRAKGDNI